jgi:hypothetical protein
MSEGDMVDDTAEGAPETIKTLDVAAVEKFLDPNRFSEVMAVRKARLDLAANWISLEVIQIQPELGKPKSIETKAISLDWKPEAMKSPVVVSQEKTLTTPFPFYTRAQMGAKDVARIYSVPLAWAGGTVQNGPIMGSDAVVIFPGQLDNADKPLEELPLDPPSAPFSSTFDTAMMARAAVVVGTHYDGKRYAYTCNVRSVIRTASAVVRSIEETLKNLDKLSAGDIKKISPGQIENIRKSHTALLANLVAMGKAVAGGDLNLLRLVMYEYSVATWGKATPYLAHVSTDGPGTLLDAVLTSDNKLNLILTADSAGSQKGQVYHFTYKITVPFSQPAYLPLFRDQRTVLGTKFLPATVAATEVAKTGAAAAAASSVAKSPPETKDVSHATPANTEKVVAAVIKKEGAVAAAAAAALKDVQNEVETTSLGTGDAVGAEKTKATKTPKAPKEEMGTTTAGTTSGPQKPPKVAAAAAKKAEIKEDPDEDKDDKKPPPRPVTTAASTAPATGKRKAEEAPIAQPEAKVPATANGNNATKPVCSADTLGTDISVALGSSRHQENCVQLTKYFLKCDDKFKNGEISDKQRFGTLRLVDLLGDETQKTAVEKVVKPAVVEMWQACNMLGITELVMRALLEKHIEPPKAVMQDYDGNLEI